jgi:dihydropyrimidinase
MYMTYEGLRCDDAALLGALEESAAFGGLVSVHAESDAVLRLMIERYHNERDMKRHGAYCHAMSRLNFVEAEAVSRAVTWARATGGALYVVHLSTQEGLDIIRRARREGVRAFAETCPHYLLFDDSVFKRKDGHLFATCPQVKKRADSAALWDGVKTGEISVVATDNCTFTKEQKDRWGGDFTKIPYGLPGVETLLPLMYTYGVAKKRIPLRRLVDVICFNPARLFGLYPRKGAIAVGSDADLVVFNPARKVTISHRDLNTACDWSPYEGFRLTGWPEVTISRGEVIVERGEFIGRPGRGRYMRRTIPRFR